MAGPAHHRRHAERAFPVGVLLAAERRRRRVRPGKLIGAVVGGVDDDRVVGDAQIVKRLQQLADVAVVLDHAIGIFVARHAALAAHRLAHMREDVHARRVHPDKERLVGLGPVGPCSRSPPPSSRRRSFPSACGRAGRYPRSSACRRVPNAAARSDHPSSVAFVRSTPRGELLSTYSLSSFGQ